MFLEMQNFDFCPNPIIFYQIYPNFIQIYPNFIQIYPNLPKFCPNWLNSAQICLKNLPGDAAASSAPTPL